MAESEPRTGQPPVPEGIDAAGLSRYLRQRLPECGRLLGAEMISGGRSNLTYLVQTEGGEVILRRPPMGHVLPTAHDMAREYRVLSALTGTEVPVPQPLALCEDLAVTGAPFYLMQRCRGVVIYGDWPSGFETSAGVATDRERLSRALVETLVHLHTIDWQAVGLGDFGRPQGFLARQVRRWGRQWEQNKTRELPAVDEIRRRLESLVPESAAATLVHGDYRLSNTMLAGDDPAQIVAVLDWEMSTIGDPLTDLGVLLTYWSQQDDSPARREASGQAGATTSLPGFWSRSQVAAEYQRLSRRSLAALDYYQLFGLYKLAVIAEGIHHRFLLGLTRGEGFDTYENRAPLLAETALAMAAQSSLPSLRG